MHIYAFGSVCRGDIDLDSDIDVLALTDEIDHKFDPLVFSIYSYSRIQELWNNGNPFAWHLHTESKLLFSSTGDDFIASLGVPKIYSNAASDCATFMEQFVRAKQSLQNGCNSPIFELSCIFLSIRNFATCYALGYLDIREFSRHSARRIGDKSLIVADNTFDILQRARLISTRGQGKIISQIEVEQVLREIQNIADWMLGLREEIRNARVQ
jgi:hypothetical protein